MFWRRRQRKRELEERLWAQVAAASRDTKQDPIAHWDDIELGSSTASASVEEPSPRPFLEEVPPPLDPVQSERLEAERFEAERVKAERAEAQRLEEERLKAERAEAQRLEEERQEAERAEAQRLEEERQEAERAQAQRLEEERQEAERAEAQRLEEERQEAERAEAQRLEEERQEAERAEALRLEEERQEAERAEALRLEEQRQEAERAEAQRLEEERQKAAGPAIPAALAAAAETEEPKDPEDLLLEDPHRVFGEIVSMLGDDPEYGALSLEDLNWMVAPAIAEKQALVARAHAAGTSEGNGKAKVPVGAILWANLSEEDDEALRNAGGRLETFRALAPSWTGGERTWIIAITGPQSVQASIIQHLDQKLGRGRPPTKLIP